MGKKYNDKKLNDEIISLTFEKCNQILLSKSIVSSEVSSVEREALFTLLMIYLYSLIVYFEKKEVVFDWTDADTGEMTISGLIKHVRDALCHIESTKNFNSLNFNRFNIYLGCQDSSKKDVKYCDDATIFFGDRYILYWRHIVKLFLEMAEKLEKGVSTKDYF